MPKSKYLVLGGFWGLFVSLGVAAFDVYVDHQPLILGREIWRIAVFTTIGLGGAILRGTNRDHVAPTKNHLSAN